MFGLKSTTDIWRAGQRKQQASHTKMSSLASSSKAQTAYGHFEQRKQPTNHQQPTLRRTSGVTRVHGRVKVDTSLKSRLRASTKALTAAVIKEQLMVANRLQQKQMPSTSEEDREEEEEEEVESGSMRVTRSHSLPLNATEKKRRETNEMMSQTNKQSVKDKKEGRRDSGGRRHSIPQSTKRMLERSLPLQSARQYMHKGWFVC